MKQNSKISENSDTEEEGEWKELGKKKTPYIPPLDSLKTLLIGDFPLPNGCDSSYPKQLLEYISFPQIKTDILSGLAAGLAQVPEATAFAIIAGVPPLVGLYAAFVVGLTTGCLGRPGMISGAAGALAVIQAELMQEANGNIDYLFATMIATGIIQFLIGFFRLSKFVKFVSLPVMSGFLNGLGIVIAISQFDSFKMAKVSTEPDVETLFGHNSTIESNFNMQNLNNHTYGESLQIFKVFLNTTEKIIQFELSTFPVNSSTITNLQETLGQLISIDYNRISIVLSQFGPYSFATISIVDLPPIMEYVTGIKLTYMIILTLLSMFVMFISRFFTTVIPASLIAVGSAIIINYAAGLNTLTVGDRSPIGGSLPPFRLPVVPLQLDAIGIVLKYSIILSIVGLLESLMTMRLINAMTNSRGQNNRECMVQGLANFLSGWLGAMGGCAMIGQSVMNVSAGGRGHTSSISAAIFILLTILILNNIVSRIPLAALAGVLFMIAIKTFDLKSFMVMYGNLKMRSTTSITNAAIVVLVTIVTVFTDLAIAVASGIVLESLVYAWESRSHLHVKKKIHQSPLKSQDDPPPTPGGGLQKPIFCTEYRVHGPICFTTSRHFQRFFDPVNDTSFVVVDLRHARVFDYTAISALNDIVGQYWLYNRQLNFVNMSPKTKKWIENSKRSLKWLKLTNKYSALAPGSIVVKYDPTIVPPKLPLCNEMFYKFPCDLCKKKNKKRNQKWENALKLGRVEKDPKWHINIIFWTDLHNFNLNTSQKPTTHPKGKDREGGVETNYEQEDMREEEEVMRIEDEEEMREMEEEKIIKERKNEMIEEEEKIIKERKKEMKEEEEKIIKEKRVEDTREEENREEIVVHGINNLRTKEKHLVLLTVQKQPVVQIDGILEDYSH